MRYPVRRSTILGGVLAGMAALNALVLAAWALGDAVKTPVHLGIALLVWLLGVLAAWQFWVRSPVGDLVWSGQSWSMESSLVQQAVPALEVHLDLQGFLW